VKKKVFSIDSLMPVLQPGGILKQYPSHFMSCETHCSTARVHCRIISLLSLCREAAALSSSLDQAIDAQAVG